MKRTAISLTVAAALVSLGLVVPWFLASLAYQCDDINDIE